MSVTLPTASLLGMLADLLHTTDDNAEVATGCVLLHATSGFTADGQSTVLVGTSTSDTTGLIGHCHEAAEGTLAPVLLPQDGIAAALATFKPLLKVEKQQEIVTYLRVVSDAGMVHVVETDDGALFAPDDKRLQVRFPARPGGQFPRSTWSTLGEVHLDTVRKDSAGRDVEAGPRRVFPLPALAAFARVARRRREPMELYTPHPLSPVHVQVGSSYRGQIRAAEDVDGVESLNPDVDIHEPVLPALVPSISPVG